MARSQIAGCLWVSEKDFARPRGKEPRHYPRNRILFVQEDRDPQKNSPEHGRKRPIAPNPNDQMGSLSKDDQKCLRERDGKLEEGEQRPAEPPGALPWPRDPADGELIELNPSVARHHGGFESVTAPHVHKPRVWLSVPQPFQNREGGIEMSSRPAPTDDNSQHASPFVRCCQESQP